MRKSSFLSILGFGSTALLLSQSGAVFGQDEGSSSSSVEQAEMTIMAADDGSGGPPMVFSSSMSSVDGGPMTMSFVGPGDMTSIEGLPFPGFNRAPDPMSMVHDPDIQKEIELDGQQLEDFKKVNSEFQKKLKEQSAEIRNGKMEPAKMKEFAQNMKKIQDEQKSRFKEILLPHQVDRLNQISVQKHLTNAGTANALTSDQLAEQLGLTDEQKEKLKKKSEDVNKELEEKVAKLKEEAREGILGELTSEQREKLEKLIGKKYKSVPREFPGFKSRPKSGNLNKESDTPEKGF